MRKERRREKNGVYSGHLAHARTKIWQVQLSLRLAQLSLRLVLFNLLKKIFFYFPVSEEKGGMGKIVVLCRKLGEENWQFGKII